MLSLFRYSATLVAVVMTLMAHQGHAALFNWTDTSTGHVCILLDSDFSITVEATKGGKEVDSKTVLSNATGITLAGHCGKGQTATLNLNFPNSLTWAIIFDADAGSVSLNHLVQFVPRKVFDQFDTDTVTFKGPELSRVSKDDQSFLCSIPDHSNYTPETVPPTFNFSVSVTVNSIQAQAFGIVDGKFGPPSECQAHNTSTSSSTESTATSVATTHPTIPDVPPLNNYTVEHGGITCIAMMSRISFQFTYQMKRKDEKKASKKEVIVFVPLGSPSRGKCVEKEEKNKQNLSIRIPGTNGWVLDFVFRKKGNKSKLSKNFAGTSSGLLATKQEDSDYHISKVSLTYSLDRHFPHAVLPRNVTYTVSSEDTDLPRKAADYGYYKCVDKFHFDLNDSVVLKMSDFKFKAFNADNSTTFTGKADECSDDDDDENIVPIIVGSVLGGIVLIIVIVFVYFRCRQRRDYENV